MLFGSWAQSVQGISVSEAQFAAYLAERLDGDVGEAFPLLPDGRKVDLLLACGALLGDRVALAELEGRCFKVVASALQKMRLSGQKVEEAQQILRVELLVGTSGGRPKIAEYSGRGDLAGFVRVTAVRRALKLLRKEKREIPLSEDHLVLQRVTADDPDLQFMKARYRPVFRASFQQALESLTDRERVLLRQTIVDGLTIDQLAPLYGVHRATTARWITRARDALISRTREGFVRALSLEPDECESIMRLVQSQLDATIRRRLENVG